MERTERHLRRLRGMNVTLLPHARERMECFGVSPAALLRVLQEPGHTLTPTEPRPGPEAGVEKPPEPRSCCQRMFGG